MELDISPCWIGIQGGTCAGKTTLAQALARHIGPDDVLIVNLDLFYRPLDKWSPGDSSGLNFDAPASLDWELVQQVTRTLKSGNSTAIALYDGPSESRSRQLDPRKYTIIEGLWTFHEEYLLDLFDLRLYVQTSRDVRLVRRLFRDVIATKEWTLDQMLSYYMESIRPMHLKYVEPGKAVCDLVISGEEDIDNEVKRVLERLDHKYLQI